jgi:hypothetical protein
MPAMPQDLRRPSHMKGEPADPASGHIPAPGALQAHDGPAGVADHPGGDVPQPVAKRLGLGDGELAVQQQRLRPADKVADHQDQLEPDLVAPEPGHVGIVLVGEEHLEAVPVGVGEAQLER